MPLRIIKGPPNSGRTEELRRRYLGSLQRDPVLVVPTTDDIFAWEERLTRDSGALVGGHVMHFRDLVREVSGQSEGTGRPVTGDPDIASPIRRRAITTESLRATWPLLAERIAWQPGLIDAALQLIDELRENLIDPGTLDVLIRDSDGRVPAELSALHRDFVARLNSAGLTDIPQLAMDAASAPVAAWEGRPLFAAGFDDFTKQQLTLLRRLAAVTEVTVAITHEQSNRAMVVAEALLGRLMAEGGTVVATTERPEGPIDHDPSLFELERHFLNREADGTLDPTPSVRFLESAGRRGEAEHVAAEIARLVADGTRPDEIAIAIDSPGVDGPVFRDVLAGYDLPATLEAETAAPGTAAGQAALNLLRAVSPVGSVDDLFAFARGPIGLDPETVDRIELDVKRKGITLVDEAAGRFRDCLPGEMLPGWDQARKGDLTGAVRQVADRAGRDLVRNADGVTMSSLATETSMTTALTEACDELDAIGGRLSASGLADVIRSGAVRTWAVPVTGTITIASPYSMRAKRFRHLFLVSLQERSLGDDAGGPFLTAAARAKLGLPEMTDPEDQDLHLFYSCLTVPTHSLTLSSRTSDVHGKAEFPSPMIGEVKRLFRNPDRMTYRRASDQIVFPPDAAPCVDELVRSVAAGSALPAMSGDLSGEIDARLDRAGQVDDSTRTFGPVSATILDRSATAKPLSASALEAFIECPYKWFFERALAPARFGPEPDYMSRGTLIHGVLATLYERHSGSIPRPGNVHDWVAEASRMTVELSSDEKIRLGTDSADHRIERQRVMSEISRFLFRESRRPDEGFRPRYFEQGFGFDDPDGFPPVAFDGWSLRGRIDRIDLSPDGRSAAVIDYKSGSSSSRSLAKMRRDGKVQLHLYVRAAEAMLDGETEVVAVLYVPLCRGNGRPRGVLSAAGIAGLADLNLYPNDVADGFGEEIERGVELASRNAARILTGDIRHRQGECRSHFHHAGVPDWGLSTGDGNGSGN